MDITKTALLKHFSPNLRVTGEALSSYENADTPWLIGE